MFSQRPGPLLLHWLTPNSAKEGSSEGQESSELLSDIWHKVSQGCDKGFESHLPCKPAYLPESKSRHRSVIAFMTAVLPWITALLSCMTHFQFPQRISQHGSGIAEGLGSNSSSGRLCFSKNISKKASLTHPAGPCSSILLCKLFWAVQALQAISLLYVVLTSEWENVQRKLLK